MGTLNRTLLPLAGLLGAAGVALAAAASHGGDTHFLGNASLMCLVHAPSLIAMAVYSGRNRFAGHSALIIALGTMLFSADLVSRHVAGSGLFPMAAPTGGMVMIGGWLLFAAISVMREKA